MKLQSIVPRPELTAYISSFWLFESDFGLPVADNRVIAPNGSAKIIIPFRNALFSTFNEVCTEHPEQEVLFIGIWDKPVTLSSHAQTTGTIGIELTPKGAYRFTQLPMVELANRIYRFGDLYGREGRELEQRIGNTEQPAGKASLIQSFLVSRLAEDRASPIVDYSVDLITAGVGLLPIRDIERKTGYSKRYLDLLFKEYLGISPKTLSTIVRFQRMYQRWANTGLVDFGEKDFYELYYDQAHFIREFRRYTGYTPGQYAKARNDFGKIFYRK